jgi:hypothetical protein
MIPYCDSVVKILLNSMSFLVVFSILFFLLFFNPRSRVLLDYSFFPSHCENCWKTLALVKFFGYFLTDKPVQIAKFFVPLMTACVVCLEVKKHRKMTMTSSGHSVCKKCLSLCESKKLVSQSQPSVKGSPRLAPFRRLGQSWRSNWGYLHSLLRIWLCTQKCPGCHARVQKIDGCQHMECRCGTHFCYACGSRWNPNYPCWLCGWKEYVSDRIMEVWTNLGQILKYAIVIFGLYYLLCLAVFYWLDLSNLHKMLELNQNCGTSWPSTFPCSLMESEHDHRFESGWKVRVAKLQWGPLANMLEVEQAWKVWKTEREQAKNLNELKSTSASFCRYHCLIQASSLKRESWSRLWSYQTYWAARVGILVTPKEIEIFPFLPSFNVAFLIPNAANAAKFDLNECNGTTLLK